LKTNDISAFIRVYRPLNKPPRRCRILPQGGGPQSRATKRTQFRVVPESAASEVSVRRLGLDVDPRLVADHFHAPSSRRTRISCPRWCEL
jgi:hypothetical protein